MVCHHLHRPQNKPNFFIRHEIWQIETNETWPAKEAKPLGLSQIRQKTQRCRNNACDGLDNAYYLKTEMWPNCGSRNTRCSVSKVKIISLAFKWLILLRLTIKTRHQTHRVLKKRICRVLKCVQNARLRV